MINSTLCTREEQKEVAQMIDERSFLSHLALSVRLVLVVSVLKDPFLWPNSISNSSELCKPEQLMIDKVRKVYPRSRVSGAWIGATSGHQKEVSKRTLKLSTLRD